MSLGKDAFAMGSCKDLSGNRGGPQKEISAKKYKTVGEMEEEIAFLNAALASSEQIRKAEKEILIKEIEARTLADLALDVAAELHSFPIYDSYGALRHHQSAGEIKTFCIDEAKRRQGK